MQTKLQIRNVEVEGFGPLGHVVMRELGDRIVLEGVNGVGKTMILTAIRAALEGKTGLPDRPLAEFIKDGHDSAIIKIDLSNGIEIKFSIRVIITADDFDLQIKEVSEDGKARKISGGPMAFLKTIVNAIAFRPQQWRKKSDSEQCEEVFNFFPGLKEKLHANSNKISGCEQERARLLARAKVLRLDVERASFTPNLPEKEIDPAELAKELELINKHNLELDRIKAEIKEEQRQLPAVAESISSFEAEKKRKLEMIDALKTQVENIDRDIKVKGEIKLNTEKNIAALNKQAEKFDLLPTEPTQKKIAEVNKTNEAIRKNAERKKYQADLESTELSASVEYKKIVALNKERSDIMASAELPIDGLSIGDGCLLYPNTNMDMVRLSALSDGEFWPVACGLVAAFNPKVRIVIVDNMHDLDKTNFEALCEASTKYGMQIWIHKTLWDEKDAGAGFLIKGGEIVGQPNE